MTNDKLTYLHVNDTKVPMIFEKSTLLPIISIKLVITSCLNSHSGLNYFAAKILDEGTQEFSSEKFAKMLEDKAISYDVSSSLDSISFSISCLKENFEFAIHAISKLFNNYNCDKKTIQKIQNLILGKISSKKSDYDFIANKNLKKMLYKNTPLQNSSLGDDKSIQQIDKTKIQKFLDEYITLQNAVVIIGGDLELNQAQQYATNLIQNIKKGTKRQSLFYETSDKSLENKAIKPCEQAYIYFGSPYHLRLGDPEYYKAKIATFILGSSGFGSRLMEKIRVENGLAYSVFCNINILRTNCEFNGYLQTKIQNEQKAKDLVKKEIENFVQKGVSEKELIQAKKFTLGSEPLRNELLAQRLTKSFNEFYSGYGIGYFQEELKQIQQLSLQSLNEYILKHDEIQKLSFSITTNEN